MKTSGPNSGLCALCSVVNITLTHTLLAESVDLGLGVLWGEYRVMPAIEVSEPGTPHARLLATFGLN